MPHETLCELCCRVLGGGLCKDLCKSISFSKLRSKLLFVGRIEIKLSPLIFRSREVFSRGFD